MVEVITVAGLFAVRDPAFVVDRARRRFRPPANWLAAPTVTPTVVGERDVGDAQQTDN
jgi:hypothetical protein